MEYVIDTSVTQSINWGAKGPDRIIQNVVNLISTYRYEVAYMRLMGLDPELPHLPADKFLAKATSEIIDLISEYEPRVTVKKVELADVNEDGNTHLKVVIEDE